MKKELESNFVTYEQAVALKKLGFDEMCFGFFNPAVFELMRCKNSEPWMGNAVASAPLKSQAFKFFREKKILGEIRPIDSWDSWGFLISEKDCQSPFYTSYSTDMDFKEYSTYEEAELACIDKLLELAKQQ